MNQDQIIEWAREAGFAFVNAGHGPEILHTEPQQYSQKCFELFAAIVADHAAKQEREACALVCDEIRNDRWAAYKNRPPYEGNETTRYSQHTEGESDGADLCADKIRARGEKPEPTHGWSLQRVHGAARMGSMASSRRPRNRR